MADGRVEAARERADSPAPVAGLFSGLKRPRIGRRALRSYRRERICDGLWPAATAMMEGGFIGVVAAKIFDVHPAVLALISAAPMFGNLSSYAWARLAHGHRKVPFILGLQTAFVALVLVVALVPMSALGAWLLVFAQVAARLVLGGIISLRSLVWTLNYPREARGRVTWRLTVLTTLVITLTSILGGLLLDADPDTFRLVYAGGALLGLAGVIAFSGVHIVEEPRHLLLERQERDGPRELRPARGTGAWRVLRDDPLYAEYQAWQFLLGAGNMMIEAPLIYLLTVELGASFFQSMGLVLALPLAVSIVTVPFWAGYIDRVHISEFRARTSWLFVLSQVLLFAGAFAGSLVWIAVARVVLGIGRGGGSLAWQLGHNDFASPERVGLYMGVHVTLTGVRGAFAPFLGMLLYVGWSIDTLARFGVPLPAFDGIGASVILAASVLSGIAAVGYVDLARRVRSA